MSRRWDMNAPIKLQNPEDPTKYSVTDEEKATWNGKQDAIKLDDVPTANSPNFVNSGSTYTALTELYELVTESYKNYFNSTSLGLRSLANQLEGTAKLVEDVSREIESKRIEVYQNSDIVEQRTAATLSYQHSASDCAEEAAKSAQEAFDSANRVADAITEALKASEAATAAAQEALDAAQALDELVTRAETAASSAEEVEQSVELHAMNAEVYAQRAVLEAITATDAAKDATTAAQESHLSSITAKKAATAAAKSAEDALSALTILESANHLQWKAVDALPDVADAIVGMVYAIPSGEEGDNQRVEYILDTEHERFEKWGSTSVDLSDYYTAEQVDATFSVMEDGFTGALSDANTTLTQSINAVDTKLTTYINNLDVNGVISSDLYIHW